MKLSVVIPSYKDPYVVKTIGSILANSELGDQLEIIVVFDGYWPSFEIPNDPHVKYVHLGKNVGMREAINIGVRASIGEYIMRTDEHCMYAKGFDRIITSQMEDNWIVTAKRYFLNPVEWRVMEIPPIGYEKLVIQGGVKFAGQRWPTRDAERKDIAIDETMAMQGSFWIMKRSWWDKVIVSLQTEGYGPLIQDSHEMIFKTWEAGGKMMLNKNTWIAHKHRSFPRMHNNGTPETPANCDAGYKYALDIWKDYYEKDIRPKWRI
jgi:glycosyltransferase involved in cell wall biosynthesis